MCGSGEGEVGHNSHDLKQQYKNITDRVTPVHFQKEKGLEMGLKLCNLAKESSG